MTLKEIRDKHPFPWVSNIEVGNVKVTDANGADVALLTLLEFAVVVTKALVGNVRQTND